MDYVASMIGEIDLHTERRLMIKLEKEKLRVYHKYLNDFEKVFFLQRVFQIVDFLSLSQIFLGMLFFIFNFLNDLFIISLDYFGNFFKVTFPLQVNNSVQSFAGKVHELNKICADMTNRIRSNKEKTQDLLSKTTALQTEKFNALKFYVL